MILILFLSRGMVGLEEWSLIEKSILPIRNDRRYIVWQILKKKNRENPHYLQSVLYVENKDCIAKERQMTLEDFGITIFVQMCWNRILKKLVRE